MRFDRFTVTLLVRRADAPELDEETETGMQDTPMSHLAELHEAGQLLATGPLLGPPDRKFRGLAIYRLEPEQVSKLAAEDPEVTAGRHSVEILPWVVPGGASSFTTTRLPRSMADANSGTRFDRLSVALLILRRDAPRLDSAAEAALQNAHMSHLADLHEAGHLLAGGPVSHGSFRGLSLLSVDPEQARQLKEQDAAVRAGRFSVEVADWLVPGGAMSFSRTRFPRSMADVA